MAARWLAKRRDGAHDSAYAIDQPRLTVRGCAPEDHASADARRGAGDGPKAGDGETSLGQADAQFREYIIKVSAHRPGPIARAVL